MGIWWWLGLFIVLVMLSAGGVSCTLWFVVEDTRANLISTKRGRDRKLSSKQTITPSCNNLSSEKKVTGTPYQQNTLKKRGSN